MRKVRKIVARLQRGRRELMEFGVRPHLLQSRVKHLHGPLEFDYGVDELLVISVVRNAELHLRSFLEHYLSMGVTHFVFLDNGSTDRTREMLCRRENVTLLQTDAPYAKYENTMKRYLAERFSRGRWALCSDIDELFDYPFSQQVSLRSFLQYLKTNRYTAVAAQMLDMFPDVPLRSVVSKAEDRLQEKHTYYDTSSIRKTDYLWSTRSNREIRMHWGGIRKAILGSDNGLTKSPLVLMDGKVKTFITWHHVQGARMADISCVLLHYPFVSTFFEKVQDAVRTGRYGMRVTDEYKAYGRALERDPDLNLKLDSARPFTGLEPLIDEKFLIVSDQYRRWVVEHGRPAKIGNG